MVEGDLKLIEYIKKRDGRKVSFDKDCITKAIFSAASEVAKKENTEPSYEIAEELADKVVALLNEEYNNDEIPNVENLKIFVVKKGRF